MNPKPGHAALRKGRVSIEGQVYLVTTTTLERQPFFADFRAAQSAAQAFEDKAVLADAKLLAWVLMPDHFHGLLQLDGKTSLQNIMNRLKSASARRANQVMQREGPLWSRAYHDHALRQEEDLLETARYIVANPMRARSVRRVGDYPFWNAIWLPTP
ncbi:REP-associated tyrosine transposase [Methylovulum miyakonense]|uniref:REP-associated tyrosine transposase n=1 Tax=Methylovulum miyakonense TaxID=645578 RepID=UPI00037E4ADA|nr:transposase [Methylovulum miyakonense]